MATVDIKVTAVCAGGNHGTTKVNVNAGPDNFIVVDIDDIRTKQWSLEVREAFIEGCLRLATQGLTNAQARAKLQNGFTVTF